MQMWLHEDGLGSKWLHTGLNYKNIFEYLGLKQVDSICN
jgi:hypothetical protein